MSRTHSLIWAFVYKTRDVSELAFSNPDSLAAYKVARYYRDIFEVLDDDYNGKLVRFPLYDCVDLVNKDNMVEAIRVYRWPVTQDISLQEYVDEKFLEFDSNQDGELNLIEFTQFMEELWNFS